MKAWLSPEGDAVELTRDLPRRAAALRAAHAAGARFLAHPVHDLRDAAEWALACFHSPVTFVPLPAELPAPALERRLDQLPEGVIFSAALPAAPATAMPPRRDPAEIWAVIFSSGTTGEPKGVALTGAALAASAFSHAEHAGPAATATWLLNLPLYHVGGLSVITRALFLEAPLALGSVRFSADDAIRWLRSGSVQGLSLVPTTLVRLLQANADFSPLSLILLGGAPAAPELVARARQAGAPVRLTYGMTEHASQIATETAPGSGLRPLPGVALAFRDGEICLRSAALAAGYFRGGRLEPLPLRDGHFATGDLGELRDGKLVIHGRASDVIVSGGRKIYPAEVEAELGRVPGVADCAVLGLADAEWGEQACAAIVETVPGAFDPARAKRVLGAILEAFKNPKRWAILPAIPRSAAGKVLRQELRARVEAALQSQS